MSEIKTIFFDVGGVLLTNGWGHQERAEILGKFHVDRDAFEARHPSPNDLWERGRITADEYLAATVFYEPRDFSPADFLNAIKSLSRPLDHTALGILQELRASDQWTLGVLSNESRELNAHRYKKFEFNKYFDLFVGSCYVDLRKPAPAIFKLAIDLVQRNPAEIVFIDDREENIDAANAAGMQGIQYRGPEELRAELKRLGIAPEVHAVQQG